MPGFAPIRRADGTLITAGPGALVEQTPLADASPRDLWRGKGGPTDLPSGQRGKSQGGDIAETSGFGRAWWNRGQDIPREPSAGRSAVMTTDRDLQLGPAPGRIGRIASANIGGLVGPRIVNSFPPDANMGYLRHQQVGKLVQGATPALKTIADDAWLPGTFAGNPLP